MEETKKKRPVNLVARRAELIQQAKRITEHAQLLVKLEELDAEIDEEGARLGTGRDIPGFDLISDRGTEHFHCDFVEDTIEDQNGTILVTCDNHVPGWMVRTSGADAVRCTKHVTLSPPRVPPSAPAETPPPEKNEIPF